MSFKAISVVGLGYVGLPLALEFAKAGIVVYGIEQNPKKVEMVNKGESYIDDVKSEDLLQVVKSGNLKAYVDFEPVKNSDAVIICVPTPLGTHKEPDISYIINVATEISKNLKKGQLIVLESTTYPGTTEEVLVPILEKSGLKAGEDFYVAFSPERVDPGNKQFTTKDIPKVVGGINQISTDKAGELYSLIVSKVFKVSSPKVAEMEKLLENIFRLVNISFINELAILCNKMGIDIWEVIQAASTKPYGFMPFYPGPGLGGHCIEGSEIVWVKDGSKSQIISLHDLFEKESIKYGIRKIGDVEVIKTKNLFVKSLDTNELKPIWKPIKYLFRRNYTGKIVKIITDDNRYLRVTDKHPMLRINENKVEEVFAENLKVGDLLPMFLDEMNENENLKIYFRLKKKFSNLFVREKTWSKIPSVKVKNIEYEEVSNVPVYSMEVEDTHTFAVGKGIFVHNCIPIDPFYLSWKAKEYDFDVRFIELAGEINDNMPKYVVQLVMEALNKDKKAVNGSKIFVIGVSYKPNIADPRESPALKIIPEIERLGGKVEYYDPYISEVKINVNGKDKVYKSSELSAEKVKNADCVLIVTDHDNVDYNLIYKNAKRIVDTRNALRKRGINIDERVTLL
jgi:nucleotide sugar dehydrogenase